VTQHATFSLSGRVASRLGGVWRPFHHNLVVTGSVKGLAAGLAAIDGKPSACFHALGVGRYQWDFALPNPARDAEGLVDEYFRKAPDSINHVEIIEGLHVAASPASLSRLQAPEFGQYAGLLVGRIVEIISGTNSGDVREIVDYESPDTIVLDSDLSAEPDGTTRWRTGAVSDAPTGVIDIDTTFLAEETNSDGSIREQGLFFGTATPEIGSGQLYSTTRHAVIAKSGNDLRQVWRLTLGMV
jgi:hypothetical protein